MLFEIVEKTDSLVLSGVSDFSPELIFGCGQSFRFFRQEDGSYLGCAFRRPLKVWTREDKVYLTCSAQDFHDVWRGYFDLERDYAAIRAMVSSDPFLAAAAQFGKGIRVLRQEPWETLITFIISQCNNIKRITGIISRLCELFGDPIECGGSVLYTFPSPEKLASLPESALSPIRAGYRAAYILSAAKKIAEGYALESLNQLPTDSLRRELLRFSGVGRKVADCVLLFGYGRTDAFPVDVWIKRALTERYGGEFDFDRYSEFSGILQQYIFHYVRSNPEVLQASGSGV